MRINIPRVNRGQVLIIIFAKTVLAFPQDLRMAAYMQTSLTISCPFCYQLTAIDIGDAIDGLELIEDCQNCCHPIVVIVKVRNGEIVDYKCRKG